MNEIIKQYDIFIDRINKIPAHEIGYGSLSNKCILCHLGLTNMDKMDGMNDDIRMLGHLFGGETDAQCMMHVYEINDGIFWRNEYLYSKSKFMLPKERLIFALQYFREIVLQNPDNHDDLNEYIHAMILRHTERDY